MNTRIEEMIEKREDRECWEWKGAFRKNWRKPFFKEGKRKIWAHRFIYEKYVGKIPEKGMIFRNCFNDRCVNPKHLQLVMPGEPQPSKFKEKIREVLDPPFQEDLDTEYTGIMADK